MRLRITIWCIVSLFCVVIICWGYSLDTKFNNEKEYNQQKNEYQFDTIQGMIQHLDSQIVVLRESVEVLNEQSILVDSLNDVRYNEAIRKLKNILLSIKQAQNFQQ